MTLSELRQRLARLTAERQALRKYPRKHPVAARRRLELAVEMAGVRECIAEALRSPTGATKGGV